MRTCRRRRCSRWRGGKRAGRWSWWRYPSQSLENTHTVSSGTLSLHYWDELAGRPTLVLQSAMGVPDATVELASPGTATAGSLVQIDDEVMRVDAVQNGGTRYEVTRGMYGSRCGIACGDGDGVRPADADLDRAVPGNFFGSPYSGSWSFAVGMPDVRIAAAELFVTNARGNGATGAICLTGTTDSGLRTLSGGQYSLQVDGYLAVEQGATPALVVDATHAVRDVFAVLGEAADADVRVRVDVDGAEYCTLTVTAGQFTAGGWIDGGAAALG